MDWTQTILDFLAAVAWPGLAAVVIWRLWTHIVGLVDRVKSITTGGTTVSLTEYRDAAAASLEPVTPVTETRAPEDEPHVADVVRLSRGDLEGIVTAFAEAGWAMASMRAFTSEPKPVIRWAPDGRPQLDYWKGEARS